MNTKQQYYQEYNKQLVLKDAENGNISLLNPRFDTIAEIKELTQTMNDR